MTTLKKRKFYKKFRKTQSKKTNKSKRKTIRH